MYYHPFDVHLKAGPCRAYIPRYCKHREVEAVNFDNQADIPLANCYHFSKYVIVILFFTLYIYFIYSLHLYYQIISFPKSCQECLKKIIMQTICKRKKIFLNLLKHAKIHEIFAGHNRII